MNFFFDYIYYRVKKSFYKRDSDGIFAILLISMFQMLVLCDTVILVSKLFVDRSVTATYAKLIGRLSIIPFGLIFFYNYKKYYKIYWELWEYWKGEPRNLKLLKGWLVFLVLSLPLLVLIFIGVLL